MTPAIKVVAAGVVNGVGPNRAPRVSRSRKACPPWLRRAPSPSVEGSARRSRRRRVGVVEHVVVVERGALVTEHLCGAVIHRRTKRDLDHSYLRFNRGTQMKQSRRAKVSPGPPTRGCNAPSADDDRGVVRVERGPVDHLDRDGSAIPHECLDAGVAHDGGGVPIPAGRARGLADLH